VTPNRRFAGTRLGSTICRLDLYTECPSRFYPIAVSRKVGGSEVKINSVKVYLLG